MGLGLMIGGLLEIVLDWLSASGKTQGVCCGGTSCDADSVTFYGDVSHDIESLTSEIHMIWIPMSRKISPWNVTESQSHIMRQFAYEEQT